MHGNPFMQLNDAQLLMRTIYHRVDVVLFGHKHVAGQWENMNGIRFVLAADNSPGKDWVREISIQDAAIEVQEVSVKASGS
jgi:hypothetical protein